MTVAQSTKPARQPPIVPQEARFVFYDVDWEFYQEILRRLNNRRVFVTYSKGTLEIMSPSLQHEDVGRLLGLLIFILAEELGVGIRGIRSTTLRRQDLDRGLEPDDCFYTVSESKIRGKKQLDLSVDPPPDLAIEVEISRRLLDRVEIYAALGVGELWRHDGVTLRVYRLDENRQYVESPSSFSFPMISPAQMDALLKEFPGRNDVEWAAVVRSWVREHLKRA
jgi:Uma2 family endonuclease